MNIEDIVLVGKPNSGKSSLFNQLTGLNQKVGNFGGVTVEMMTGKIGNKNIIDLPGLKSLRTTSPEEKISKLALLNRNKTENAVVLVANGAMLEDSLMLFSEVADLQFPMLLVINFKDELERSKITIDTKALEQRFNCPIVFTNSRNGEGIKELKHIIVEDGFKTPITFCRSLYDSFEGDIYNNTYEKDLSEEKEFINQEEFAKRKKVVASILKGVINNDSEQRYLAQSKRADKVLLHPIWGILIFLMVMFLVFQSVFTLSAYPMDWIDMMISKLSSYTSKTLPQGWINNLIADALIPGIGGVLIFIPQIAILFLLLGILEHIGYLSRISILTDAFLRRFGLSGKSVIPLMSSWACAIPAIMSTRIIDDPKERMAVILASPLMTCSARLPVYTILIAVIFPVGGSTYWGVQGLALLSLYLLGVVATLVVAWLITKRSKIESAPFWSMELPIYRMPNWRNIGINVYNKTKSFVVEAGKVILAISILLWILSTNSPKSETFIEQGYQEHLATSTNSLTKEAFELEYSYIGYIGKFIEPAIQPLGYDWKIGIALLSSFAAREVFVGTLSTIYSIGDDEEATIVKRLRKEKDRLTGAPRYNMATAVSLLMFYVFAMQCMSTLAIVKKETGQWKYAAFQFVFMLVLAYVFAFGANVLLS